MPTKDITGTILRSFEVLVEHVVEAGVPWSRSCQRVQRWTVWVCFALPAHKRQTKSLTSGIRLERWPRVSWHQHVRNTGFPSEDTFEANQRAVGEFRCPDVQGLSVGVESCAASIVEASDSGRGSTIASQG